MLGRTPTVGALFLTVTLATLLVACDDGGDGAEPTPGSTLAPTVEDMTATATLAPPTAAPTPTATAAPGIRDASVTARPELQEFLGVAGGEVAEASVVYADVTGDGDEDAIVPVSSGGEGGDIALFVFGFVDGQVRLLLQATPVSLRSSIRFEIVDGRLVTTEADYGPDDPLSDPSRLRMRFYRWDGSALVMDHEEFEEA